MKPVLTEEERKEFDKLLSEFGQKIVEQIRDPKTTVYNTYVQLGLIADKIHYWIESLVERKLEEVIKLSDDIELKADHTEFEEWKAFKEFRNTLRDKYLKD